MKKRTEAQIERNPNTSGQLRVIMAPPEALAWLQRGPPAQVLHVFKGNINLLDKDGAILSLVQPRIGAGPFSAVVDGLAGSQSDSEKLSLPDFTKTVGVHSTVRVNGDALVVGGLSFQYASANQWDPKPAWHQIELSELTGAIGIIERAIAGRTVVYEGFLYPNEGQLPAFHRSMTEAWNYLSLGLHQRDPILSREGAAGLAGLGSGFTPAGDDFLVGVMYALYAAASPSSARFLATAITEEAVSKTTRLSAAWLRAAMRGEATEVWHSLILALASKKPGSLIAPTRRIRETGHSSGVAALSGFVNGLKTLMSVAQIAADKKNE